MLKKTLFIALVALLGGCAYALDDSIQDVKIETPGAHNAVCTVNIDRVRYVVRPPQKIRVLKSRHDMEVDCKAPGNRRKTIFIEPGYQASTGWNVLNGGAGAAWDYASNAMFRYPDIIEVNFTDTPVTSQPLPAQNSPDIRAPEDYPLEEFNPSRPRMNDDASRYKPQLLRRGEGGQEYRGDTSSAPAEAAGAFSEPAQPGSDKGDLKNVIDGLSSGGGQPVPLVPGQ